MMEHQDCGSGCGGKLKLADSEDDDNGRKQEKREGKKVIDEGELKRQERVCPICNKKFSSGKALGGHMSSKHVQQAKGQKNKSCSKKLIKRKYYNLCLVGDYYISGNLIKKRGLGLFTCDYCDRVFESNKSLFGHMRVHPNRPYRGMEPPGCSKLNNGDNFKKPAFEELEEEEGGNQENWICGNHGMMEAGTSAAAVDLAQDLVGRVWLVKGRRGGGGKAVVNNEIHDDDEEEEDDDGFEERCMAGEVLMHLHNSGGSKSNLDDGRVVVAETRCSATPMAAAPPSEGMGHFMDFSMTKKTCQNPRKSEGDSSNVGDEEVEAAGVIYQLKNKAILENGNQDNSSDDTKSDDELVRKLQYARKGKEKIVEKKKKRKHSNGDKIITKKEKSSPVSAVVSDEHVTSPSSVAAAPPPPPPPPRSTAESGREFRCPYCGKVFKTYQALGGHKSSHNKFKMSIYNTIDELVPPAVADKKTTPTKGRRICKKVKKNAVEEKNNKVRRVLDFDLNRLPEGES